MRPEDLVFWLDVIRPSESITGGVLCRRHADSMIVPRNWTLDDLRDPELHLFRPPAITRAPSSRARRSSHRDDTIEQLQLGVDPAENTNALPDADVATHAAEVSVDGASSGVDEHSDDATPADSASPWVPTFDSGDDLDGLLSARSPLLARAFRGDDRRS